MQVPQWGEGLQGLDQYEQMVDTFAEQAKSYWELWGTMVQGVEAWAQMQHVYLNWLRQSMGGG